MTSRKHSMSENNLAKVVVDAACQVHIRLGPGWIHFGPEPLRDGISRVASALPQDPFSS